MASFERSVTQCRDLSALFQTYCDKVDRSLTTARNQTDQQDRSYSADLSRYAAEHDTLLSENTRQRDLRLSAVRDRLDSARRLLNCIPDLHWFRVQQHYYNTTFARARAEQLPAGDTQALIARLNQVYTQLEEEISRLGSAFIPPQMANVVGYMVPSFRKQAYTRIATLRNKLLYIAAALGDCRDLDRQQTRLDNALATARQALSSRRTQAVDGIRGQVSRELVHHARRFSSLLRRCTPYNALRTQHPLKIGQYTYPDARTAVFQTGSDRTPERTDPAFTLPVTCSGFDKSTLLRTCPRTALTGFYACLAVDILAWDPTAHIAMIDITGLGRNYTSLAELAQVCQLQVLSTAEQVQTYLETTEHSIAQAHAGSPMAHKTYIFIDDCIQNIPERCIGSLSRIMANGASCGVYVIASVKEAPAPNRHWASAFPEADIHTFQVRDGKLLAGTGFVTLTTTLANRADTVRSQLETASKAADVLPIRKAFPAPDRWQKCSSADGIRVPIGVENTTGATVYFQFTEEKPYGLIVGDVDVGKSSALHCITLQILANYAPDEVRIAVGDFKNGCEFNSYVHSGIMGVDTVVSSKDPDAMSSFLGCYVAELQRRQTLFNAVSAQCGKLIRKYETYREACREHQLAYVPRICLIIDEFQNLFDCPAAGTAAALSELVRNGRTYGIHIIMASQRAVFDTPHSGFTTELKNYFTTRLVFRCPQQVARSMLSERCADTGRENPGIPAAALLKKGHAVMNTYMGQNERDNRIVQCFYASDDAIKKATRILQQMNGLSRRGILLEQNAPSAAAPGKVDGYILLGESVRLRYDESTANEDVFRDNSLVAIDIHKVHSNILVTGSDVRMHSSVFRAVLEAVPSHARIRLCGARNQPLTALFCQELGSRAEVVDRIEDIPADPEEPFTVNLIVEPEKVSQWVQTNAYRQTPTIEHFDRILDLPESGTVLNIIFTGSFRTLKTGLPYLAAKVPVRIVGIGDLENLRSAIGESTLLNRSAFDTPSANAVKAYYYNKTSGKTGKIILYLRTGAE